MCRVMRMPRSGFYAWLKEPESDRKKENQRLVSLIRQSHEASDSSYGSPRITRDMREMGERCSENRVARAAQGGSSGQRQDTNGIAIRRADPHWLLSIDFEVEAPDRAWVIDITYIRTWDLAVVLDLFSRMVIGWYMKSTLVRELALDALLMAVWRRKPQGKVIVHSDQGAQYGSDDWVRFCRDHNLDPSMSRRGNCYDNAVAESFFSSLKKERIGRRIYPTRQEAKQKQISSITSRCSTTGQGVTVILDRPALMTSKGLPVVIYECLQYRGNSKYVLTLNF